MGSSVINQVGLDEDVSSEIPPLPPKVHDTDARHQGMVERMYRPVSVEERREAYDYLAQTYDDDFSIGKSYATCMDDLVANLPRDMQTGPIIVGDVGCGTGRSGKHLVRTYPDIVPRLTLIAIELSPKMLQMCERTGAYDCLVEVDITKPFELPYNCVDAVVAAGIFYDNHVDPDALVNVLAVLRVGGIACVSTRESTWERKASDFIRYIEESNCEIVKTTTRQYQTSFDLNGMYLVLRKLPSP